MLRLGYCLPLPPIKISGCAPGSHAPRIHTKWHCDFSASQRDMRRVVLNTRGRQKNYFWKLPPSHVRGLYITKLFSQSRDCESLEV